MNDKEIVRQLNLWRQKGEERKEEVKECGPIDIRFNAKRGLGLIAYTHEQIWKMEAPMCIHCSENKTLWFDNPKKKIYDYGYPYNYSDNMNAFKCSFEFYFPCARMNGGIRPAAGTTLRVLEKKRLSISLIHKIYSFFNHWRDWDGYD